MKSIKLLFHHLVVLCEPKMLIFRVFDQYTWHCNFVFSSKRGYPCKCLWGVKQDSVGAFKQNLFDFVKCEEFLLLNFVNVIWIDL